MFPEAVGVLFFSLQRDYLSEVCVYVRTFVYVCVCVCETISWP